MDRITRLWNEFINHINNYKFKYGLSLLQVTILQEECAELIQVLSKRIRNQRYSKTRITEEIAHVLISIAIVCIIYEISLDEIMEEVLRKDSQL